MTTFSDKEVTEIKNGGNKKAAKKWLVGMKKTDFPTDPNDGVMVKAFMKNVYELKKFMEKIDEEEVEEGNKKTIKKEKIEKIDKSEVKKSLSPSELKSTIEEEDDPFKSSAPFTMEASKIASKQLNKIADNAGVDFFAKHSEDTEKKPMKEERQDMFDTLLSPPNVPTSVTTVQKPATLISTNLSDLYSAKSAQVPTVSSAAAAANNPKSLELLLREFMQKNYWDFPTFLANLYEAIRPLPGYDERLVRAGGFIPRQPSIEQNFLPIGTVANPFLAQEEAQNPFLQKSSSFPDVQACRNPFVTFSQENTSISNENVSGNPFGNELDVHGIGDSTLASRRQVANLSIAPTQFNSGFASKSSFPSTAPAFPNAPNPFTESLVNHGAPNYRLVNFSNASLHSAEVHMQNPFVASTFQNAASTAATPHQTNIYSSSAFSSSYPNSGQTTFKLDQPMQNSPPKTAGFVNPFGLVSGVSAQSTLAPTPAMSPAAGVGNPFEVAFGNNNLGGNAFSSAATNPFGQVNYGNFPNAGSQNNGNTFGGSAFANVSQPAGATAPLTIHAKGPDPFGSLGTAW